MDTLKKIVQTFAYVLAGITISTACFITIFIREDSFHITLMWEIIVMAAVCSLGNFIYYYKTVLSKKQMRLRIIGHYLFINAVVFTGALSWGWINPKRIPQFLLMLVLIAAVYTAVMIANFRQEAKTAEVLNRQLRRCYPPDEEKEGSK